jgi:membrane protein DedA with SNARE-associated domain
VLSVLAADPTSAIGYSAVFWGVLFGSVIPVVPTGAIVGAGAAVAVSSGGLSLSLPLVVLVATAGALIGDLVTFGVARAGHGPLMRLLSRRQSPQRLEDFRGRFARHGWLVVVVGRLLPAGRIPSLLAAGALAYPWRRLVPAAAVACLVWGLAYTALGALTGGLFDDPFIAPLLGAGVVLVVGGISSLIASRVARRRRIAADPQPDRETTKDTTP